MSEMTSGLVERGIGAALIAAANITSKVWVENRVTHDNGTEMWSEVRTNRPHLGQIAHCAEQEDADLIAHLINAALAARVPLPAPPAKDTIV